MTKPKHNDTWRALAERGWPLQWITLFLGGLSFFLSEAGKHAQQPWNWATCELLWIAGFILTVISGVDLGVSWANERISLKAPKEDDDEDYY